MTTNRKYGALFQERTNNIAEQIIQGKKQGVGKDSYLGVVLKIAVKKCLKITGTKIIFSEKSLKNTYEKVHIQLTRFKNESDP